MTLCEGENWAIKTLLHLQSSSTDSVHALRDMLCEAIQTKYGHRRNIKPVPVLGPNNKVYMSPDELTTHKQKKTSDHAKAPVSPDNSANNSIGSASDDSRDELKLDLTCCVCESAVFCPWNPIVECADCKAGYHKECHDPEIMEDVSDPRVVWYCCNCSKAMQSKPKSMPSLPLLNSNKTSSSSSSSGKQSSGTRRSNSPPVSLPSSSYTSSKSSSFGGKRPSSNKLSVLSSGSTKPHNPKINIISADRRLQIMKKKAARKHDKRSTK
ncbi:Hypothetical proteinD [Nesidiocoris tenuis]|uniref:PHD-type domain-containing protein n=1 Tax=Nesidiocoris tenuis TaxID=355587 RepID=A0ABN7ACK3_9HEMI|nr:Hypothetical proteinD [Nesidiocoris tenuis]